MGLNIEYIKGQTPLDEDEKLGLLIDTITSRGELDEFEQLNIEDAIQWTLSTRWNSNYILSEEFIRLLHKKMFCDVWSWAGEFRRTDKNIGVDKHQIAISLRQLIDNCKYWIGQKTFSEEEIAIRFKHEIVKIHCFPNGNGRHSRLIADIIISHIFNNPVFTWGRQNLGDEGEARRQYLNSIYSADKGDYTPLIQFAKSTAF